jgi:hypothetical protein
MHALKPNFFFFWQLKSKISKVMEKTKWSEKKSVLISDLNRAFGPTAVDRDFKAELVTKGLKFFNGARKIDPNLKTEEVNPRNVSDGWSLLSFPPPNLKGLSKKRLLEETLSCACRNGCSSLDCTFKVKWIFRDLDRSVVEVFSSGSHDTRYNPDDRDSCTRVPPSERREIRTLNSEGHSASKINVILHQRRGITTSNAEEKAAFIPSAIQVLKDHTE